jgi:PAS domain S-box-containing protein
VITQNVIPVIEMIEQKNLMHQHKVIAQLSLLSLTGVDLQRWMDEALYQVVNSLGVEYGSILELDPSSHTFLPRASLGWQEELKGIVPIAVDPLTQEGFALHSNKSVIFHNREAEIHHKSILFPNQDRISGRSVVIQGQGQPFGVLSVYSTQERTYTSQEVNFLEIVAILLATAIDRKQKDDQFTALNQSLEEKITARTILIRLLQEVTVAVNEARSVAEGMYSVLEIICETTRWDVAHIFMIDERGKLIPTTVWYPLDPGPYEAFRQETQNTDFLPEKGLPGRAYMSRYPSWAVDITQEGFHRSEAARQSGLKAGFAFPVLIGDKIVCVMEFFTNQCLPPDKDLLMALANIGNQIGRVIERRRAEELIQASQKRLAEAQRMAQLGSWEWDIQTNNVVWSDELYNIYGLKPHQLQASYDGFLECVHPEDREKVTHIIENAFRHPSPFRFDHRIVRPNGEIRTLYARGEVFADENGNPVRMLGTGQDVTERREMERSLQTHEHLLHTIIHGTPLILWAVDPQGKIILIEGKGLKGLKGLEDADILLHEWVGTSIYEQFADWKVIKTHIDLALSGEEVVTQVEFKGVMLETQYSPMYDENHEVIGVIGISVDVTKRILAEKALHESEMRFRTVFEAGPFGIVCLDLEGQFTDANSTFLNIFGYDKPTLKTMSLKALFEPTDVEEVWPQLEALFSGKRAKIHEEKRFAHRDGRIIWLNCSIALVRKPDEKPDFVVGMFKDITARKQLESELSEIRRELVTSRENERLHLAQEIHDDPLQELYGLLYQLDSLRETIGERGEVPEVETLNIGLNQVIQKLRAICGELRPPTLTPFGLEGAIREHADQFQSKHPGITVLLDLMYDGQNLSEEMRITLFRIYQQALSNSLRHAEASHISIRFRYDQRQVLLEIEDNGKGFEVPFRWVEFVRQKHLGLAGAAERAQMVNGHLEIISKPGKGTSVRVTAPR